MADDERRKVGIDKKRGGSKRMKKMQLYRKIIATLHDGKELRISVYKAGRAIELRFFHPKNGLLVSMLVHPRNVSSPEGWIHEIGVQYDQIISVVKWRWENDLY